MGEFAGISCIILSAGNSDRMGAHKALLPFDDRSNLLQHITGAYQQAGISRIVVVVNSFLFGELQDPRHSPGADVELAINPAPELGRLSSLCTGVEKVKANGYCFFQNVDNPFTTPALLSLMASHRYDAEVIIPSCNGKTGHPVLLAPQVLEQMLSLKRRSIRIDYYLQHFVRKTLEYSDERILGNINTIADYNIFFHPK